MRFRRFIGDDYLGKKEMLLFGETIQLLDYQDASFIVGMDLDHLSFNQFLFIFDDIIIE